MRLISWNVNGIRAAVKKGFMDFFDDVDADIFCLQETKLSAGQLDLELEGYHQYWNYAEKKGYSGTAVFTKEEPIHVSYGIDMEEHDKEGRVITCEYEDFFLVTCYTPNSQRGLARLDYRMEWEEDFRKYLNMLDQVKPVVLCGDLNVAHKEIVKMRAFPTKSAANFKIFWTRATRIPSATSTPMRRIATVGGATSPRPGKGTPVGASTTLS